MILFMCISSSADDPPEPHRLEPVGVQGREVDDRVRPNSDADERGAHSLITPAVRGALLLVLERLGLGDGGLGCGPPGSTAGEARELSSAACRRDLSIKATLYHAPYVQNPFSVVCTAPELEAR